MFSYRSQTDHSLFTFVCSLLTRRPTLFDGRLRKFNKDAYIHHFRRRGTEPPAKSFQGQLAKSRLYLTLMPHTSKVFGNPTGTAMLKPKKSPARTVFPSLQKMHTAR